MVRSRETKQKGYSDEDLSAALQEVKKDKISIRVAAEKHNVPRETLRRFVIANGENDCEKLNVKRNFHFQKIFTADQENLLVEYLLECNALGNGLSVLQARKRAWELAVKNGVQYPESWDVKGIAGPDWWSGFSNRHPNIALRKGENCSLQRKFSFNAVSVSKFYDNLESLYNRFPEIVENCRIYNLDETATTTVQAARRVVAEKGQKQVYCNASAEKGTLVTTVGIICANGTIIPPVMIFPRVNFKRHMLAGCYPGTLGLANPTGWMTTDLFYETMKHFVKHTNSSKQNQSILVLDNHESRFSIPVIDLAKESGVNIVTLVPHSSHRLQPLDRTVYGPFKNAINEEMANWMATNPGQHITIYEMASFVHQSLLKSATRKNIDSGFKATGIFPFNRHIFDDEFRKRQERQSTSSLPAMEDVACYEEVVATTAKKSSPPDNGAQSKHPGNSENSTNSESENVHTPNPENPRPIAGKKRKFVSPKELFGPQADEIAKKTDVQPVKKKRRSGKTVIITDTPNRKEILQTAAARARTAKKPGTGRKATTRKLFEETEEDGTFSESESDGKLILDPNSFRALERTPVEGDFVLVLLHAPSARSKSTVIFYVAKVIKNVDADNDLEVSYLRTSLKSEDKFVLPNVPDLDCVNLKQVKALLPQPQSDMRTKRQESLYSFNADFSKLRMG